MPSRGIAGAMNAILWGSGYLYSKRGRNGIFAILAHLALYSWAFILWESPAFWGPILVLGSLYFAFDGYKYAVPRPQRSEGVRPPGRFCRECGAQISAGTKFCPECGASQANARGS